MNKRNKWDDKVHAILWVYIMDYKKGTGYTPFQLVYGLEAVNPMEFVVPNLRITSLMRWDDQESLKHRLDSLNRLDEHRRMAEWATQVDKARQKAWHDRNLRQNKFKEGDLVLLY